LLGELHGEEEVESQIPVRLLKEVRAQIDNEMSVQKLQILMCCLSSPDGIDQQRLFQEMDQSRSAVSKNIADLTAFTSKKLPGPALLVSIPDPMNLTTRIIRVTPKGRQVWRDILDRAKPQRSVVR